jgi:hypothetical protein
MEICHSRPEFESVKFTEITSFELTESKEFLYEATIYLN